MGLICVLSIISVKMHSLEDLIQEVVQKVLIKVSQLFKNAVPKAKASLSILILVEMRLLMMISIIWILSLIYCGCL